MWLPGLRLDLVMKATPEGSSGACPIVVAPSWKVIIPLGVPPPAGSEETVAVIDTVCPKFDGLGDETRARVDALGWTFCTIVMAEPE